MCGPTSSPLSIAWRHCLARSRLLPIAYTGDAMTKVTCQVVAASQGDVHVPKPRDDKPAAAVHHLHSFGRGNLATCCDNPVAANQDGVPGMNSSSGDINDGYITNGRSE
jgi:hypothetical protein